MKAGIYARVSTDDQQSQNQLLELRDFVRRRGYDSEEFIDNGLSGKLTEEKRPEFHRLLEAARYRKIDIVISWELSRLARTMKQLVDVIHNFGVWNVGFTTLRENIDTTTANGRLIFHIFAALAEFERELIVERTKLGLKRAIAEGKKLGRPQLKIESVSALLEAISGLSLRVAEIFLSNQGIHISKSSLSRLKLSQNPPVKRALIGIGEGL